MYNQAMYAIGFKSSMILEVFECGKERFLIISKENIFDYNLGNTYAPSPRIVNKSIIALLNSESSIDINRYSNKRNWSNICR